MFKIELDEADFDSKFRTALEGIGLDLVNSMKEKLTNEHGKDTGELQSGINYDVKGNTIIISMPETGKFLEWGTPPHFPPPEALKGWVTRKWNSKDPERDAWILAYSISRRGTRPFPFIRPTINNESEDIMDDNFSDVFS